MLNTFVLGLGKSKLDKMANEAETPISPNVAKFLEANFNGLDGKENSQEIITETVAAVEKLPVEQKTVSSAVKENTPATPTAGTNTETTPATGTNTEVIPAANTEPAKSIFKKPVAKPADDFKFETTDDWKGIAKKYGVEVKEPKDFTKFTGSIDKWRTDAQKLPEAEKLAGDWKAVVETLDPELFEAVKAFHGGQNWREVANKSLPFDIKVSVDKQDVNKLVEHYFPGKFTKEDFENEIKPAALEIAEQASKDKFLVEQNTFNSKRAKALDDANKRLLAKNQSVDSSVGELMKSFPDLDDVVVNDVKSIMSSGDILSHFINKDGSYKPEAAKALMLAKYGEQELTRLLQIETNKIESKVTEEIVDRGSNQPGTIKPGGKPQELSDGAKRALDSINRIGGTTTFT